MVKDLDAPYEAGAVGRVAQGQAGAHPRPRRPRRRVGVGTPARLAVEPPPRCRADPDDGFVMLGKTFKGLTDETLTWQTEAAARARDPPRRPRRPRPPRAGRRDRPRRARALDPATPAAWRCGSRGCAATGRTRPARGGHARHRPRPARRRAPATALRLARSVTPGWHPASHADPGGGVRMRGGRSTSARNPTAPVPSTPDGWCGMHYKRWLRTGSAVRGERPEGSCAVDGCDGQAKSRGWCHAHYQQWRRHGDESEPPSPCDEPGPCRVDGCDRQRYARELLQHPLPPAPADGDVREDEPIRIVTGEGFEPRVLDVRCRPRSGGWSAARRRSPSTAWSWLATWGAAPHR
jgi:hypothetical protein